MEVKKEDLHIGDVFRYDENTYCKVTNIASLYAQDVNKDHTANAIYSPKSDDRRKASIDPPTFIHKQAVIISVFDNIIEENIGERLLDENITEVEVVYRE